MVITTWPIKQGPQVPQEQAHCGGESLDADLRHRECSERLVREPHRSRVGWDDVPRTPFCKKNRLQVGRSSMADRGRRLWKRSNFKEISRFLESNRISLVYGLTSNKDQIFMNKVAFFLLISRNVSILCHFRVLLGA